MGETIRKIVDYPIQPGSKLDPYFSDSLDSGIHGDVDSTVEVKPAYETCTMPRYNGMLSFSSSVSWPCPPLLGRNFNQYFGGNKDK